jgi:glycosyltransferase involved in cell wall biosynthesis
VSLRIAMVGLRAPGAEGGVESAVAELAPRLARRGHAVTVYCRGRYNPHGDAIVEGVRLVDAPTVYGRTTEAFVHTGLAAPRAALRHDVVHLHACGPALFTPLVRALGRPAVVTLHGLDWEREKWGGTARAVLRSGAGAAGASASAVIAVSEALRAWAAPRFRAPVHHVPNGVSEHVPAAWDGAAFPALSPGRYLLFLGRIVPEKGLDTLLRAAAQARLDVPIVITGGAAYTDAYAARLRREAPANVIFTGPRFGAEKRMLLTHARGFVFPSHVEGLPIALLEAMAAGLPVAASSIAPNAEALRGVPHASAPPGDVGAWARALEELATADPSARARCGEAGRARARAAFGWERVVDATEAIYVAAAGQRGGRGRGG